VSETLSDSRSSVYIARSASGKDQFAVKVYKGDALEDIVSAKQIAVAQYRELEREFNGGTGTKHGGAGASS
jgi:hypothetical protein